MPLKLWLPLDGTNENRGISGVTMAGSPASWGNGRTGKCATFNNNTGNCIANTTKEFDYTVEDFSWAMWLKKDFASKTASAMYAFSVGRPDAGGRGYGLAVYSSTQLRLWFGTKNYDLSNFPDNEWFHVAFTRKGNAIKIYKNGELVSSQTFNGTLPTYSDGNGPGVGCFHYTGNIYPLIGAISDFRIYNHTLSAKEVYELSRALIVHYPLSAPGNANPNLLTWSKNYTKATPFTHTSAAKDGWINLGADSLVPVTPGKLYYVQVKSDGIPHSSHASSAGVVTNKFTLWFYIRNIGTTKTAGSGYDATRCFTSADAFINDPDRHLFVWAWYAPSNAQDIALRTNSYSDGSTSVTLHFWDFKIEEGTYTAYVPSANSAQYGELGYGTGTVRDATGRGIDLSTVGAPVFSSEAIRYATAINFNKAGYLKLSPYTMSLSTLSVSFWFNAKDTTGSTQHFLFGSFASWPNEGLGFYRDIGKNYFNIVFRTAGAETTYCSCGGQTFSYNEWHHMAFTWDGTTVKIYLDNVLKTTKTYGQSGTCEWKNIFLGNSAYNSTPASETEDCKMSDFRIYGTALSADDVKYLYETSAAIDNNGDMFADSFEETEMLPRVGKEGLVYGKNLSESGGTVCAYANTNKGAIDPNRSSWSYTPTTADNSCMTGLYFWCISGVQKYRIELLITWSGFADISTSSTNFNAFFQGYTYNASGNRVWVDVGPMNAAMNSSKSLASLAKGAASGTYLYNVEFTLPNTWPDTYKGNEIGIRTNYSNGTGKWTISKVRIYPADEHMVDQASLCSFGAIQTRLADEVHLA